MDEFAKFKVAAPAEDEFAQFKVTGSAAPVPKQKPGFLQPGSKSDSFIRGASQAATLGFGDEIQALMRTLGSDQTYSQIRDDQRGANAAAADTNPASFMAGSLVGASGAGAASIGKSVLGTVARSGAVGASQGLGTGEGGAGEQLGNVVQGGVTQAALGGIIGAGGAAINSGARKMGERVLAKELVKTPGLAQSGLSPSVQQEVAQSLLRTAPVKNAVAGSTNAGVSNFAGSKLAADVAKTATDGVRSPLREGMSGAMEGISAGFRGADGTMPLMGLIAAGGNPIGAAVPSMLAGAGKGLYKGAAANAANKIASGASFQVGAGTGAKTVLATSLALQQMSGQEARQVNDAVRAQIEQQSSNGRPIYASTFEALSNSPAYRVASDKVLLEDAGGQQEQDPDEDLELEDENLE